MNPNLEDLICIKKLGKGGFGEVNLYQDLNSKVQYAVKTVDKSELKDSKYLQSEINILKMLDHPNIIKLKNVIDEETSLIIIMEYCNGGSLSDCLYRFKEKYKRGFPEEIIQYLMRQIVDALDYIHDKNIIHRDLKLQNIMIHFDNEIDRMNFNIMNAKIKIIDFGVSKLLSSKYGVANSLLGTAQYMAPEILFPLKNKHIYQKIMGYGKEADIWCLGSICYELLRAKALFKATSEDDLVEKINIGIYDLPKTVSKEYISFLNAMLQFEGKKRKTIKELKQYDFITKNVKDFTYLNEKDFKKIKEFFELRNSVNSLKERANQISYKKYNSFEQKPIPEESFMSQSSINNKKEMDKSSHLAGGYSFFDQPVPMQSQHMNSSLYSTINQVPINKSYSCGIPSFNRIQIPFSQIPNGINHNQNFNTINYNYYSKL